MIEKVLEAYIAKTAGERSLWEKIKGMNLLMQLIFWGNIGGGLVVIGINFFIQSQTNLIILIVYVIVLYISTFVLERMRHNKWKTNLKKYNEDMDVIAEILNGEEFNLYEKNKIKQLIKKYYQSIYQHDSDNAKKGDDLKQFVYTYIVPVVAFFAGRLNTTNFLNVEWIAIGIVILVVLASVRYIYSSIAQMVAIVSWNQSEKEKHFVLKLQDLLDRDFKIEESDLISIK